MDKVAPRPEPGSSPDSSVSVHSRPASVSARLAATSAYSYRADPAVPAFDDGLALIVYDGVCVLCSITMRAIATRNVAGKFQYASAQSPLGQALFRHYGLDLSHFETALLITGGRAFGKFDMVLEIARGVGGFWHALAIVRVLPRPLQDRLYDLVARNRYRIFGRRDACMLPDQSWRTRVIDHPAP